MLATYNVGNDDDVVAADVVDACAFNDYADDPRVLCVYCVCVFIVHKYYKIISLVDHTDFVHKSIDATASAFLCVSMAKDSRRDRCRLTTLASLDVAAENADDLTLKMELVMVLTWLTANKTRCSAEQRKQQQLDGRQRQHPRRPDDTDVVVVVVVVVAVGSVAAVGATHMTRPQINGQQCRFRYEDSSVSSVERLEWSVTAADSSGSGGNAATNNHVVYLLCG